MNAPLYSYSADQTKLTFEFQSISQFKTVEKRVVFSRFPNTNVYNLLLGDLLPNGQVTDMVVTNNDDLEMVLATVAHIMIDFFELRPDGMVYFTGSNAVRTRLYRIVISNYMNEFKDYFVVLGIINGEAEIFENNKNYDAYLISWIG